MNYYTSLIMSTSTGKVRPGVKAKTTALQPRSLNSIHFSTHFLLPSTPSTPSKDRNEAGAQDNVEEQENRRPICQQAIRVGKRVVRRSYTREFKLKALTMLQGHRVDLNSGESIPAGITCKFKNFMAVCSAL